MDSKTKFPVECFENIFDHLSVKDLLECMLASAQWNSIIGSTASCMRKILLKCPTQSKTSKVLNQSHRKYQCLELNGDFDGKTQALLKARGRKWMHLKSKILNFESVERFLNFLGVIEKTVQKLILEGGSVNGDYNPSLNYFDLQFPNLKHLHISNDFAAFYDKAFINCKHLKTLSIETDEETPSALEAIRTSLKSNNWLRNLTLNLKTGSLLDESLFAGISFKLKDFSFTCGENLGQVRLDMNSFLKTQKDSIETLSISGWMGTEVMQTILSMKRLEKFGTFLRMSEDDREIVEAETFPKNLLVTHLKFVNSRTKNSVFEVILKAFPHVRVLKVFKMTEEVGNTISRTCKRLKHLSAGLFYAEKLSDETFFLNIEKFRCREFAIVGPQNDTPPRVLKSKRFYQKLIREAKKLKCEKYQLRSTLEQLKISEAMT